MYVPKWSDNIRTVDVQGLIIGNVYDVSLFRQGSLNLCWAYCQTMIENFNKGGGMTQAEADVRARKIAEDVNGTDEWNKGGWPTNSIDVYKQIPNIQKINSFADLNVALENGPVYAYYNNVPQPKDKKISAHLIVVTGTVSALGHQELVASNNPWGDANIQTYDKFIAGIPRDNNDMILKGILR